jgi:hypothetical protein
MPSRRDLIAELHRVAALPPSSGRHAAAKASALRELLRIEDESDLTGSEERLWDEDRDPEDRVDALDWHPDPDSPFAELDAADTVATRRNSWLALAAQPRRRGPVRI